MIFYELPPLMFNSATPDIQTHYSFPLTLPLFPHLLHLHLQAFNFVPKLLFEEPVGF